MRVVAFLRAINTGKRRVTSDALKQPFIELGLTEVQCYQASGNVIFDAPSTEGLQARIETALADRLGFDVPTYLRSGAELRAILAARPFSVADLAATTNNVQIMFLERKPDHAGAEALAALATDADQLVLLGREVHWLPRVGVGTSELNQKAVVKALGPTTIRGRGPVERILDRYF